VSAAQRLVFPPTSGMRRFEITKVRTIETSDVRMTR
jgi:hypothetical protein